jgi:hypothetical protein
MPREQQRHRVVVPGVAVDQDLRRHSRTLNLYVRRTPGRLSSAT